MPLPAFRRVARTTGIAAGTALTVAVGLLATAPTGAAETAHGTERVGRSGHDAVAGGPGRHQRSHSQGRRPRSAVRATLASLPPIAQPGRRPARPEDVGASSKSRLCQPKA